MPNTAELLQEAKKDPDPPKSAQSVVETKKVKIEEKPQIIE